MTGETDKNEEYQIKAKENVIEILSHWHPNLTINLVDDHTPWVKNSVPPPLNECNNCFYFIFCFEHFSLIALEL